MNTEIENDRRKIEHLGGPAKVCELLGYSKQGSVQRVHNWMTRGIPPRVKVDHPEIFMIQPDKVPA